MTDHTDLLMQVPVWESVQLCMCSGRRCVPYCASRVRVRVRVRVREGVRAVARAENAGPESPWCRETPCGAWLCGSAEEAGLRMGWFMLVAKMTVIRAL